MVCSARIEALFKLHFPKKLEASTLLSSAEGHTRVFEHKRCLRIEQLINGLKIRLDANRKLCVQC